MRIPLPQAKSQPTGGDIEENRIIRLMKKPSTYAGIVLLFIASTLIFLPGMPPDSKDFLMVAFACIALLPGNGYNR